jgi:GT2 family glycosyltransferase
MVELSIVILNYRSPKLVVQCVESILKSTINDDYEIIIVDNHSEDSSKSIIQHEYPDIEFISNTQNEGYGRGNNLGVQFSKGKYVLILNSDVVVATNTIQTCLTHIKEHKQIGILSCAILNSDGTPQNYTSTIANYRKLLDDNLFVDYFFPKKKYVQEALMGSFLMFDRNVFTELGGFDPDFFMYSEEIELCHRFKKNDYIIKELDSVSVYHMNGGSTNDRTWANRQSNLSLALLFYKVHGLWGYIYYHLIVHFNFCVNLILMWKLDSNYRTGLKKSIKNYFVSYITYFKIPFKYSRNIGTGDKLLKYEYN